MNIYISTCAHNNTDVNFINFTRSLRCSNVRVRAWLRYPPPPPVHEPTHTGFLFLCRSSQFFLGMHADSLRTFAFLRHVLTYKSPACLTISEHSRACAIAHSIIVWKWWWWHTHEEEKKTHTKNTRLVHSWNVKGVNYYSSSTAICMCICMLYYI